MLKRRTTIAVLLSGVLLAIGGAWTLFEQSQSTSGDLAAVESALRGQSPPSVAAPPTTTSTTTTLASSVQATPPPQPAPPEPVDIAAPIGLRIDDLDVDAPVRGYGVDEQTGQMAVPDNITEVGWYEFGPSPGEAGSAVLAAHVDLASSGPGVFFELRTLEEGDSVVVLLEDGTESRFRVVAKTVYDKDELPLDVIFSREGPAVLTLITCGGGFNSNVSSYDSNVVVYAVPDLGTDGAPGSTL